MKLFLAIIFMIANSSSIPILKTFAPIDKHTEDQIQSLLINREKNPTLTRFKLFQYQYYEYHNLFEKIKIMKDQFTKINGQEIKISENKDLYTYPGHIEDYILYLKPLTSIYPWDEKKFQGFKDFCDKIKDYWSPNYKITIPLLDQWFPDDIIIQGSGIPSDHWASQFLKDKVNKKLIDLPMLKDLLINMCKYSTSDYSIVSIYYVKRMNTMIESMDYIVNELLQTIKILKKDIELDDMMMINGSHSLVEMIPEYSFERVIEIPQIALTYKALHQLVMDIPDAKEWVTNGSILSENKFIDLFVHHPTIPVKSVIGECLYSLKMIYNKSWSYWVKYVLAIRGIGIRVVDLEDCDDDMKIEPVCIYWYKEWKQNRSKRLSHQIYNNIGQIRRMAKENEFNKLLELIECGENQG